MMMLLLVADVIVYCIHFPGTDGGYKIAILPTEQRTAQLLMNPLRRTTLDVLGHIGRRILGPQTHEQMDMIRHSVDLPGDAAQAANGAAKPGMESRFEIGLYEIASFLRTPHEVVVQTGIRRAHYCPPLPAPLQGANVLGALFRGLRSLRELTPGYYPKSLRDKDR